MSPPVDLPDDPRLDPDHVRTSPDGTVTLIGVVHDHPASVYRVERIVDAVEPSTLALELPALAVPLYEAYASTETPRGGEMSAAIRAADDADIVGVDGPSRRFFRALVDTYRELPATPSDLRRVFAGLRSVTRRALMCRLAAPVARWTRFDPDVDTPTEHGCSPVDEPPIQARDERRQIDRSIALLGALDGGGAIELRDRARESAMAAAIDDRRGAGDIVAVVGRDHLDEVADRLDGER